MCIFAVTPLVGVWIEIKKSSISHGNTDVTPLVGVWIEIVSHMNFVTFTNVTPLVGVWIEIIHLVTMSGRSISHSPCGSVD